MKRGGLVTPSMQVELVVENGEKVLALIQKYTRKCEESWKHLSDHKHQANQKPPPTSSAGGGWVWGVFWFTLAAIVAIRTRSST